MPNEPIDTQFILYQLRRQGITNRNDVIKTLRASGLTSFEANEVLNAGGLGNLTRAERSGFPKIYKGQIGKGAKRNLREIAASFPTLIGGAIVETPKLLKTLGKAELAGREERPSTQEQQALNRLRSGSSLIETALDLPLGQYNITTERIGNTLKALKGEAQQGPMLSWDDFLYGVTDNPLYSGVDVLTLGGGSAVKGVGKGLSKTRVGKRINALREFNRLLNTASIEEGKTIIKQEPTLRKFERTFRSLSKKGREAVSRALQQTGETEFTKTVKGEVKPIKSWNKALELARESALNTSNEMINLGLVTREQNANNIIANYMGNNLGWKDVNHDTLFKWIEKPETMPKKFKPLYNKGKQLQREGRLVFISQAVNPAQTNALGTRIDIAPSYHEQARYIGTQTPEQMAEYLPQALDFQARHASSHRGFQNFVRRLKSYDSGKFLFGDADAKYYSADKLLKHVREKSQTGASPSTIMRSLPEATPQEIKSGNAIALGKTERDALNRYLGHSGGSNQYLNMFKRAVLGGTKWFTENRIQNTLNNIIEGVTPKHTWKAMESLRKGDYPKELDVLTKSYGYAGNLPSPATGALGEALERMGLGVKGAFTHLKEKDLRGAGRSLGEIPLGAADFVSNPMFDLEAQFDRLERLANYEKQAEDIAKQSGKSVEDIKELAKKDGELFEQLYRNVNRSLGDYTSKLYYMPKTGQEVVEALSPFWRFPYNTIRTTAHQIMDKPIGSQLMTILPSKAGRELWYQQTEPIDPKMEGGYPTGRVHPTSGKPTVISSEGHPLTAVINQFTSDIEAGGPEDFARGLSPVLSLVEPLTLRNSFGKPAQTKRWGISRDPATGAEVLFKKDPETGLPVYEEQTLSPLEYTAWLGSQGLKQFYSPVVHGMNEGRKVFKGLLEPLYRSVKTATPLQQALESATMYPAWDDELLLWGEGDVSRNPTVGASSILGPLLGIREKTPYEVPEKAKRNAFKALAKRTQKRKTPFLEGYVEYNVEK